MNDAVGASSAFPLPLLQSGENAVIVKVGGRGELHRHLETLGFVEGADLIVEVKGTQVALDRSVASRIMARVAA